MRVDLSAEAIRLARMVHAAARTNGVPEREYLAKQAARLRTRR